MNILNKLGGVDKMDNSDKTIITVNDGFDKKLQIQTKKIVLESKSKAFLKNKITEWAIFKDIYYIKGSLDDKYYDNFIETANNIFILPFYCDDNKELAIMVKSVYNATNKQLYIAMMNNLDLFHSIKLSIKHLFMAYKCFIEKIIEKFMILRNEYINILNKKKSKPSKINDYDMILDKWIQIDINNNINTSSIILFFNFPSKKITLEKSIKKMEWSIPNSGDVNKLINKFLLKIKSNNFYYCGFCPLIPIERFKILIRFPITELINAINLIQLKINNINQTTYINSNINNIIHVINSISLISNDINDINDKCITKITKKSITEGHPKTKSQYIKLFETYIDAYLDIYTQIIPLFIKKEASINILLTKVDKISNKILHICDNIILKE
jgi:hypothetical protein